MKIAFVLFFLLTGFKGFSQEYIDFFKSNMVFSGNYDSVETFRKDVVLDIVYFDSLNTEISRLGFDSKGELKYYQISLEYYDFNNLKQVWWDSTGNLSYIELIDAEGNETTWKKHVNNEISILRQNNNFIGLGLVYYGTGGLKTRSIINRDSVFNVHYSVNGAMKKEYYTYKLSNILFGHYVEYNIDGRIICEGEYYYLDRLRKYVQDESQKGNSVDSGIKHGIWNYYNNKGKKIRREYYEDGIIVSTKSNKKKNKRTP